MKRFFLVALLVSLTGCPGEKETKSTTQNVSDTVNNAVGGSINRAKNLNDKAKDVAIDTNTVDEKK